MDTYSEEYRSQCEARTWLRAGYTDRKAVDALVARITAVRGPEAAGQLREEMRRQWQCRRGWLQGTPGAS